MQKRIMMALIGLMAWGRIATAAETHPGIWVKDQVIKSNVGCWVVWRCAPKDTMLSDANHPPRFSHGMVRVYGAQTADGDCAAAPPTEVCTWTLS